MPHETLSQITKRKSKEDRQFLLSQKGINKSTLRQSWQESGAERGQKRKFSLALESLKMEEGSIKPSALRAKQSLLAKRKRMKEKGVRCEQLEPALRVGCISDK